MITVDISLIVVNIMPANLYIVHCGNHSDDRACYLCTQYYMAINQHHHQPTNTLAWNFPDTLCLTSRRKMECSKLAMSYVL